MEIAKSHAEREFDKWKAEGFITGLGAKLFTVAGPVLPFDTAGAL